MSAYLIFLLTLAGAADWQPLGKPNCPEKTCVVREGGASFNIAMTTERDGDLTYLRKLEITNAKTGSAQAFETPAVNGAEGDPAFRVYAVKLRPGVIDLALFAYESADAGAAYVYFLYDPKSRTFARSASTIPKLVRDGRTGSLRTALQGVSFVLENNRLRER